MNTLEEIKKDIIAKVGSCPLTTRIDIYCKDSLVMVLTYVKNKTEPDDRGTSYSYIRVKYPKWDFIWQTKDLSQNNHPYETIYIEEVESE